MPLPTPKTPYHRPKALIFDIDKTLTEHTSWYQLTQYLGADVRQHARIFTAFFTEYITYEEMQMQLMRLWLHSGAVSRKQLERFCELLPLRLEAVTTLEKLQAQGYELCLISNSFALLAETTARRLGISHWYGNSTFAFDQQHNWQSFTYDPMEARFKVRAAFEFMDSVGLQPTECLAIGDGENDIALFKQLVGVAIYNHSEHLSFVAWRTLNTITELPELLASLPVVSK